MNDGHRGQQSFVTDASNTGLGDDLVGNGDFTGVTNGTLASSLDANWQNYNSTDGSSNSATIEDGQ